MALITLQQLSQLSRPRLMGILNLTPDSFSDGGRYLIPEMAMLHAEKMIQEGADILDLGAESTRPGSSAVPLELELERIIPLVKQIRAAFPEVLISIDTRKSEVARKSIALGAQIINDISALNYDPRMVEVLTQNPQTQVVLMHMQGCPESMQDAPHYSDVVQETMDFFEERIAFAVGHGIARDRLMLDPGIGFGKDLNHNLSILAKLDRYQEFGLPVVVGASRKRFIDAIDPSAPDKRSGGSLAAALISAMQGIQILRVHNVQEHQQFFAVLSAIASKED